MNTATVPIIENKTGDSSDKLNYRPIVLGTASSNLKKYIYISIIL